MDNKAMKEILNELFSHLERLETQNEAILQFLKEKKRVTDKQLAPYLEQAGNASNVKWRAARVRIDHLLSPEQPEKEAKLGKKPELHEEPAREQASDADSVAALAGEKQSERDAKEEKRVESVDVDKEGKGVESADQKRTESSDKDVKKIEPKNAEASLTDLSKKEKTATVETVQARPADDKKDKPEEKLESAQKDKPAQDKREQKADSVHHPAEVTEPLVQQEDAEPTAQPESKEKKDDQEAA